MTPGRRFVAAAAVLAGVQTAYAEPITFTSTEQAAILAHGPWPPATGPDPSNRVSGKTAAIALGRRLFFDKRLSVGRQRACASCHQPSKAFADGRTRSVGRQLLDRNSIALANLRLNRWFGWSGAADSLWAQSIRPILDPKELGLSPVGLQTHIASDQSLAGAYANVFGSAAKRDAPELVLVNVAKALAAYQETIRTGRTLFDDFRDALKHGDATAMARYPIPAQRGLRLFVGKGNCSACHLGPNFTSGEFEDVGVPYFVEKGRVDSGRHGGIGALLASSFNLLGAYNDDPSASSAAPTRHIEQLHRNWGEFRVPSLRNVALSAPYMHNGSLARLTDVIRHYSNLDEERLHGHEGARVVRPLHLSRQEIADLEAFLRTLSGQVRTGK